MSESSDDSALVMVDYLDVVNVNASDDSTAVPALADENVVITEDSSAVGGVDKKSNTKMGESKVKDDDKDKPTAHQIVSIGTEEDAYAFHFDEEKLNEILKRIPMGWEVAVVSVVGAFRTGKSFLLSWFLRYLHCLENGTVTTVAGGDNMSQSSSTSTAQKKKKKNADEKPWYEQFPSLGNDGFDWKAGSERNTTGIWMWSHPHFIQRNNNQKPLAVLLVDTQGMFDHETTMSLTASIFGFSTLLSSFQIYNVDKRIQEDNLQQLALFSEYARSAMGTEEKEEMQKKKEASLRNLTKDESEKFLKEEAENKVRASSSSKKEDSTVSTRRPFQQIEFLVRDWQVRRDMRAAGDYFQHIGFCLTPFFSPCMTAL